MRHLFYESFEIKEESFEDFLESEDEEGNEISREYSGKLYTDPGLRELELRIDFERFLEGKTLSPVEKDAIRKKLSDEPLYQTERKALSRARKKLATHLIQ